MATWKKVIVSGSNANLSTLSVDNLTSGQVVIGGGTGNLSTTAINGTGTIVATTGASGLSHSGSFSGTFQGTITGGNAFIQGGNSPGTTAVLGTNDTQNLQLETSGSVRMTISSSGNIGIGTTTPVASLHIKPPLPATSGQSGVIVESNAGTGINLISDNYNTNQSVTTFGRLQSSMAAFLAYAVNQTGSNTTAYQSSQDAFANRPTALELGNAYFALKYNTSSISRPYGTNVPMATSLYLDGTSGRIGIGTQTPQGILHISSSGYGNETYPFIVGFNQFVVSGSGQVGIGTTTPSALLHVNNTGTGNSFLVEDSTNPDNTPFVIDSIGNVGIGISTTSGAWVGTASLHIVTSGVNSDRGSSVALRLRESASNAQFNLSPFSSSIAGKSLALNDDTTGAALQVWTENGNVGIGTETPTSRLTVSGNIDLTSSVSTAINIQSGVGVRTYIASDGGGTAFGSLSNHAVYFTQNNVERARIDIGGNFGIGKVSPNARLDVSGSAIITGSLTVTGTITGSIIAANVFGPYGGSSVISASHAVNSAATIGTLTFSEGLTTGTFNGSSNVTLTVSGAAQLTDNAITKWNNTDNKFVVSSLTDNGTIVSGSSSIQLTGASSSLTGSFTGSFIGNGSGLTGLATTLRVSGSAYSGQPYTSGSVSLTSQGLIIQGTQNEVDVAVTSQTVTVGLPSNVTIGNNLTVNGNLYVDGTTTTVNTTDLLIEDKFILLASGSLSSGDAGIIIDRGSDANLNIAFGFDADTDRWGYQNGLSDSTNAMTIGTNGNSAFAGIVFTEAAHISKPTTGEFVVAGAIYTANDESIWMYS